MELEQFSHCALCRKDARLHQSHILPAFVFRWLRESSATGYFRFGEVPNRRVQDGIKLPLLCLDCESRLSRFETAFATNIFHPWNTVSGKHTRYGEWLLKFCVSVSWRVLKYVRCLSDLQHFDAKQQELAETALDRWSQFILGDQPHPGMFEQHLLPFGPIESRFTRKLPNNINRYFLRAVELDVAAGDRTAFTYAKLGKWALFGFIQPPDTRWIGTKVHVRTGVIEPGEYILPGWLMDYFENRAIRDSRLQSQISDAQQDKIESAIMRNKKRFESSATLEAMLHDQRLFGTEAILRRREGGEVDEQ